MILLLAPASWAAELYVVRSGETVDSIAEHLGDAGLASRIRDANQLSGDPAPGAVLTIPDRPGAEPRSGFVMAVTGDVTIRAGTLAVAGRVGDPLPVGSVVCTGPLSHATVRLGELGTEDHDDVNLLASTCLAVESSVDRGGARASVVSLQHGGVSVGEAGGSGELAVRTGASITAAAAGGFRVTVEPTSARVEAIAAPVVVLGMGVQLDVPAGYGSRVADGRSPTQPTALLQPGTLLLPAGGGVLRAGEFSWTSADGALGYRLEIASSPDFSGLVLVEDVSDTTWTPDVLLLPFRGGGLHWRVASFDRTGFLGPPCEPRELRFPPGVGP